MRLLRVDGIDSPEEGAVLSRTDSTICINTTQVASDDSTICIHTAPVA